VTGEIACGVFPRRAETLALLNALPAAPLLGHAEVLGFIDHHSLAGRGIGFVDIHLLASTRVASAALWTRDRRMQQAAIELNVAMPRST